MVATIPATTSADAPASAPALEEQPTADLAPRDLGATTGIEHNAEADHEGLANQKAGRQPLLDQATGVPFPAFVALIQSGPRRARGCATAKPQPPSSISGAGIRATRRSLGRDRLHPAWLDAIPASIDDLQGTPAPVETELEAAVRETVELGARHREPRLALPRGAWPWWAWVTYASTVGAATFAGLYLAAIIRLAMPTQRGLWIYRTRRSAARFVLASTAMMFAMASAFTIVPPSGPTFVADIHATTEVGTFDLDHWQAPATVAIVRDPVVEAISPLAIDAADAARVTISMGGSEGEVALVEDQSVITEQATPSRDTPAPMPPPPDGPASGGGTRVIVANTGGRGVAFRNSPSWDDRMVPKVAVREGSSLTVLGSGLRGDDGTGGSTSFTRVRDAAGRTGFVPSRFVQVP